MVLKNYYLEKLARKYISFHSFTLQDFGSAAVQDQEYQYVFSYMAFFFFFFLRGFK